VVWVLRLQCKVKRSVRNQNELLIEPVRCEFERYVTPSPLPTVQCVFCAGRWTAAGKNSYLELYSPQILQIWRRHFFFPNFFTALNKPHASSTAESHFFFFFAGNLSTNPHPLSWSSFLLLPLATGSVSSSVI